MLLLEGGNAQKWGGSHQQPPSPSHLQKNARPAIEEHFQFEELNQISNNFSLLQVTRLTRKVLFWGP